MAALCYIAFVFPRPLPPPLLPPPPPPPTHTQHYAARNGHMDVCTMLVEHGASVNGQTNGTHTRTHTHRHTHTHTHTHTRTLTYTHTQTHTHKHIHTHTCTHAHTNTHVHTRAHAHTRTPCLLTGGATPLHRAAYSGHTNIAELLIKSGAEVGLVDSDGKTALHKVGHL